jgi:hypothetical protein
MLAVDRPARAERNTDKPMTVGVLPSPSSSADEMGGEPFIT